MQQSPRNLNIRQKATECSLALQTGQQYYPLLQVASLKVVVSRRFCYLISVFKGFSLPARDYYNGQLNQIAGCTAFTYLQFRLSIPMTIEEAIRYRRSVRHYQATPIDSEKVKHCLQLATWAPNSSNMQLWEFYHVTHPEKLKHLAAACLNQKTAATAQQLVVFVTRQDLYRKRARQMLALETENVRNNSPAEKQAERMKRWHTYYSKVIPFLYARFFGVLGLLRKLLVHLIGLFRPITYQVSEADMRVVVHKSCALAAENFMLAMAGEGYDTCPMEGFDSRRVKRILQLPHSAEITMVVSCGIREPGGVWGDRMRVPFEEVYKRV